MKLTKRLLALCVAMLLLLTLATGCGKDAEKKPSSTTTKAPASNESSNTTTDSTNNATTAPLAELTDCTVTVTTTSGTPLNNIGVSVYADQEQNDLVDFARTNEDGLATLNAAIPVGSYIFLTDVPEVYIADSYYTINQKETAITLSTDSVILGEVMADFTVTDGNGTEYVLSTLLESKKAVVLNFWYTNCQPCVLEFPYLQQAYDEYQNDVALLALNPVDNAEAVAAFIAANGLTFPMMACEADWSQKVNIVGYPTTVVIDRFGIVSLIHCGGIDNSKTFKNVFAFFTADDYEHCTFANIQPFIDEEDTTDTTIGEDDTTIPSTTTTTASTTTTTGTKVTVTTSNKQPTNSTTKATTVKPTKSTTKATTAKSTKITTKATTVKPTNSTTKATTVKTTKSTTKATTVKPTNSTTKATTTKPTTGSTSTQPSINTNGKLSNPDSPIEKMGRDALSFSAEVKAGEMVLFNLYKISGTVLHISDSSAYVIYLDETYTPDSDGNIDIPVTSSSPNVPVVVKIGNSGKTNKTYAVTCAFPKGSMMNPYDAKAGNVKTQLEADNDQGVYYACVADKDGEITITLNDVTDGVQCGILVTVVDSDLIPIQYSLSQDSKTLTVEVYEGDEIEIIVATLPDENHKYPAATVEFTLTFS